MNDYCNHCMKELNEGMDADPNGDMGSVCIRCRTEESIDFDEYPNAFVHRNGEVFLNDECEPVLWR